MTLRRHIALVGLPGAGKTRVGAALAAQLDCGFADSDQEVERAAGATVSSIFASSGESAFRSLERDVINRLVRSAPKVIALGGGAFQATSVRRLLLEHTLVIWLDVPEEVLVERLSRSKERPLLTGGDLLQQLRALSDRRLANYAKSHARVDAATSPEMTRKILSLLAQSDDATFEAIS